MTILISISGICGSAQCSHACRYVATFWRWRALMRNAYLTTSLIQCKILTRNCPKIQKIFQKRGFLKKNENFNKILIVCAWLKDRQKRSRGPAVEKHCISGRSCLISCVATKIQRELFCFRKSYNYQRFGSFFHTILKFLPEFR